MRALVRRLHGTDRDAGITLVELLVSTVITGVVLTMLAALVVSTFRSTSTVSAKNDSTRDGQTAMAIMTKTLRVAQPVVNRTAAGAAILDASGNQVSQAIVSATPGTLTFYASLAAGSTVDPTPTRVTYGYDATRACLLETKVPGTAALNATGETYYRFTATPVSTCIARGAVNTDGSALFTYSTLPRATASAAAQLVSPTTLPVPATGLSAADLRRVMQVGINLDLTTTTGGAKADTGLNATVSLVNTLNKGSR